MSDLGPRSFRRGAFLLLLAASLLVACLSLQGDVLGYDDAGLLYGSSGGRGALQRGPASFFSSELFYYAYLPFYGLSYWLDGIFGAGHEATFLFHLQNVLWHAATGFLVFCVLGILVRHRLAALLGALLFVVHPLHVESVAWIAGRKELLSGFFLFLAWLLALKAEERRRGLFVAVALASFLVACFSKASAVVLPFLLLAAALLLPRYAGRRRRAALATWPFFLVAIVPVIVHLAVGVSQGVVSESRPFGARVLGWMAAWGASVYRTVLPFDLSIDYPEARTPGPGLLVFAGLLLLASGAAFLAARRRAPVAAFGIAAFFLALLPFNNVFPATEVLAADRYLYLALFGVAAVAAWGVQRWSRGTAVLAVILLLCTGLSLWSGSRFRSDEELWTRTIAARDASALAHFNRGAARVNRARTMTPRDPELLREGLDGPARGAEPRGPEGAPGAGEPRAHRAAPRDRRDRGGAGARRWCAARPGRDLRASRRSASRRRCCTSAGRCTRTGSAPTAPRRGTSTPPRSCGRATGTGPRPVRPIWRAGSWTWRARR